MAEVPRHPEYKIKIEISRMDGNPGEDPDIEERAEVALAMTSYSTHAPDLEVALPMLNEGINERWSQLIEMAGIAESDDTD